MVICRIFEYQIFVIVTIILRISCLILCLRLFVALCLFPDEILCTHWFVFLCYCFHVSHRTHTICWGIVLFSDPNWRLFYLKGCLFSLEIQQYLIFIRFEATLYEDFVSWNSGIEGFYHCHWRIDSIEAMEWMVKR